MQTVKRLVRGIDEACENNRVLVCLPFAGGGASAYNNWKKILADLIHVCPVQLPGREDRIMEKPYKDMERLVEDIVKELCNACDRKIYLLGHSMGGKIAYETAKKMQEKGRIIEMLIVSGSRVPHIPEPNPIYHLPDDEFISAIKRFNGMPQEILENRVLLDFFLPILRADFEMDEVYYTQNAVCLNCPILGIGGSLDAEANEEDISLWREYTNNRFDYKIFEGGHFFIKQSEKEVIHFVKEKIGCCD